MALGRTHIVAPLGASDTERKMVNRTNVALRALDRRKPIATPSVFRDDASRPAAEQNSGRIIFVQQADGTVRGQYSDGQSWQTFLATAVSFAAPTVTYATTAASGSLTTTIRSDATLKFPTAVMSSANSSTLTLTDDATDQTFTGSLGLMNIVPGTGLNIRLPNSTAATFAILPNTTTAATIAAAIDGRPAAGTRTLLKPNWFSPSSSDSFSSQTFRCWDAAFTAFVGQHTSSTFVGYDGSSMTINPSASSGSGNKAYGVRAPAPVIGGNTSATWTEVVGGYFNGPRRSLISPTITVSAGIITEPATCGGTEQMGIYIRQQTAGQTATTRYGLKIDAQNSGTTKYAIHAITDQSYLGPILQDDSVKLRQGTGQDAELYYDGTDFVCDPDVVGTGSFDIRGPLKCDSITNDTGLAAGVFTPTRSAEVNLDANVTMSEGQYARVGNTVTMSGRFTANPTAAGATSFEFSLPVASNIGAAEDLSGTAFCGAIAGQGAEIIGSVANNTAVVQWIAVDVTNQSWAYTLTYQVI